MEKKFFVYILASKPRGTLYVGVTSDLPKRIWEHREKVFAGFTSRYQITTLVWYEPHEEAQYAIAREKRLKRWNRDWKFALIEKSNPLWRNLYEELGPMV
jgi:putative endonuclease